MAHRLVVMEWLYKADQDFGFAKHGLFSFPEGYYDQFCFFFQQAAEKYFKAYIVKYDLTFGKIHDLIKLLAICTKHNENLAILEDDCKYLNAFYLETRYADEVFAIHTKDQAEQGYVHAEKIQKYIRKELDITKEIELEDLKKENEIVDKILKHKV